MIGLTIDEATSLLGTVSEESINNVLPNAPWPPRDANGNVDPNHPLWPTQSRIGEENQGFGVLAAVRAIVANKWFWEMARMLPNNDILNTGRPGAPQHYPDWVLLMVSLAAGVSGNGTYSASQNFFKDRAQWNLVAKCVDAYVPEDMVRICDLPVRRRQPRPIAQPGTPKGSRTKAHKPERRLDGPAHLEPLIDPPSAHHLDHFHTRWRGIDKTKSTKNEVVRIPAGHRDYGIRDKILAAFRRAGLDQATAMGLFDPKEAVAFRKPNRNNYTGADGVVFEMIKRAENPTADNYMTGTGREVFGSKFTIVSTRIGGQYHSRVILDFLHTHKTHTSPEATAAHHASDESQACVDVLPAMKQALGDGLHGLLVDSVVRGQALMHLQHHDLIVVNYPHAEKNPNAKTHGRLAPGRAEKDHLRHIISHEVPGTDGKPTACHHPVYAVGGHLVEAYINDQGNTDVRLITDTELLRRGRAPKARHYLQVRLTCAFTSNPVSGLVPLFHDGEDGPTGANWGEVCRVYGPGTPEFKYLYGTRNDTEARHSDLKARMKYMPHDIAGQELRLLGAAFASNAMGWQVHLQAHGVPNVIDNTDITGLLLLSDSA